MSFDLYPENLTISTSSNTSLYSSSSSNTEVDLRDEVNRFLYGDGTEIAKGQPYIYRRMRLDDDNKLISCRCVDEKTNEPDIDTICSYCWGEGYYWDEEWFVGYKRLVTSGGQRGLLNKNENLRPGIINAPTVFFYAQYNLDPSIKGKIIELKLDTEGNISTPYERLFTYKISTVETFRSDNGRIEFFRIACIGETVKSNWQLT